MEGRDTSAVGHSALIDLTQVPLERLAELESPALTRLLDELTAEAGEPRKRFYFSSVI